MIPPDEFIPVAERTGLIGALTLRVLNSALLHLEQWTSSGFDLSVAVNLSGRNVHDAHLPDRVAALLAERHAPSNRLEFELTESQIMQDPARARLNLLALKAMGVKTSIDDFGTGYSSLDYLRKLSVDTLKIDKSFVSPGLEAEDDSAIVKAAIDLGHNLGLNVVAEGVENRGTLDRLTALGCDAAQGYFFARPMSNADLREWLISSQWSSLQRPARL
jgi:EAL domain-containing protein (putative c-di-GMP-specific phosphodiesterase class I)